VRSQICSSTPNLLLRGNNSDYINNVLCGLSDDQLTSFFKFVSSDIDFTKVKRKVYKDIYENLVKIIKKYLPISKEVKAILLALGESKVPLISHEQAAEMLGFGDFHENIQEYNEENDKFNLVQDVNTETNNNQ
jgi:hypothetical protein